MGGLSSDGRGYVNRKNIRSQKYSTAFEILITKRVNNYIGLHRIHFLNRREELHTLILMLIPLNLL